MVHVSTVSRCLLHHVVFYEGVSSARAASLQVAGTDGGGGWSHESTISISVKGATQLRSLPSYITNHHHRYHSLYQVSIMRRVRTSSTRKRTRHDAVYGSLSSLSLEYEIFMEESFLRLDVLYCTFQAIIAPKEVFVIQNKQRATIRRRSLSKYQVSQALQYVHT